MIKKLFILSSKAGNNDFDKFEKEILACYEKYKRLDEIEIVKTKSKDHLEKSCQDFLDKDYDTYDKKIIYACGGDGSLSEIANIIAKSDKKSALGLIPMGTANDFAKNLNYKNFSLEDTFEPKLSKIDLIKINGNYCINIFSIGFDAEVLAEALNLIEKYPFLGKSAYGLAVAKIIFKIKANKLKINFITENGKEIKKESFYIFCVVCNGAYYGSGFNPAPGARLDDGFLNLLIVDDMKLIKILTMIKKYKSGDHLSNKHVSHNLVKRGRIVSDKEMLVNIDGYIIKDRTIDFEIVKGAIDFHLIK